MAEHRPDLARILRYSADRSPEGSLENWTPDLSTISGSLSSAGLTETERTVALKITEVTVWVISLPWDVSVKVRDRIQFETLDGQAISPFRLFDVRYASDESEQWEQRILAIEIIPDAA